MLLVLCAVLFALAFLRIERVTSRASTQRTTMAPMMIPTSYELGQCMLHGPQEESTHTTNRQTAATDSTLAARAGGSAANSRAPRH